MEKDVDDLDNLFDEYESITRPEDEENENQNADVPVNEAKPPERVPVPKRIVRNPRLKFDAERLCGARGIPVLAEHFKNMKFKGKGHEEEDLNKLLATLSHWCHRLYPSMKFDDCLRQIVKLGKKRQVQTCLRKMRLGMPILSNDFVHDDDDDEMEHQEIQNEAETELPPQDDFDKLFDGLRDTSYSNFTSTPITKQVAGNTLGSTLSSNLSEEQRKRMEYNRLLAAERRKAKLASTEENAINQRVPSSELIMSRNDHEGHSSNLSTIDLDMNGLREESSSSLKFQSENVNSDFADSESLIRNMDAKVSKLENVQASEELGLDELMDLVEEEPQNGSEKDEAFSVNNILPCTQAEQLLNDFKDDSATTIANISKTINTIDMVDKITHHTLDDVNKGMND